MNDHDHHEKANRMGVSTPAREHQQVWELLPWLANGTASAQQRERATAHLAACADCRRELEAQQLLQQAVARTAPHPGVDAEAGLLRLFERLDAPAMEQPLPSPPAPAARREASRLTLALAVAVVVQAVGLGVLGLRLSQDDSAATYRVLSQQPASAQRRASLQVVPAASMTMADWQRLLQEHQLRVVDGPNEAGSYALAPTDQATSKPMNALLAALRATPGVRLAEPIAAVP